MMLSRGSQGFARTKLVPGAKDFFRFEVKLLFFYEFGFQSVGFGGFCDSGDTEFR